MRTYVNKVVKPLHDIRHDYPELHNPDPRLTGRLRRSPANCAKPSRGDCFTTAFACRGMNASQRFGRRQYRFRSRGSTLRYVWSASSRRISFVFEMSEV